MYEVPAGKVAVVRNILFNFWGYAPGGLHGPNVVNVYGRLSGTSIFSVSPGNAFNGTYEWEGREIFDTGDGFYVATDLAQCSYRINGFLLATP